MPSSAAAVEFAGPRQVRVAAVALPEPGPDEVVVTTHGDEVRTAHRGAGRRIQAVRPTTDLLCVRGPDSPECACWVPRGRVPSGSRPVDDLAPLHRRWVAWPRARRSAFDHDRKRRRIRERGANICRCSSRADGQLFKRSWIGCDRVTEAFPRKPSPRSFMLIARSSSADPFGNSCRCSSNEVPMLNDKRLGPARPQREKPHVQRGESSVPARASERRTGPMNRAKTNDPPP